MNVPCEGKMCSYVQAMLARRAAGIDRADRPTEAAVLLPLVDKDGKLGVLFEVRSKSLSWQPGEVCFPGGKKEKNDCSLQDTAVRETCEELNLTPEDMVICGQLDFLVTNFGPIVYPYVGNIGDLAKVKPSCAEVSEVFVVPLMELMKQNPRKVHMELANRATDDFPFDLLPKHPRGWLQRKGYDVYFYEYEGHVIWGLTAGILYSFMRRLKKELPETFFDD